MAETLGIGVVGGVLGIALGAVICLIIGAVGPGLSVTSTGLAVGASKVSGLLGQTTSATVAQTVHLTAPIHPLTIAIAFAGALLGGLIAGAAGGWRAARSLPPPPSGTSVDARVRRKVSTMTQVFVDDNQEATSETPLYELKGVTRVFTRSGVAVNALGDRFDDRTGRNRLIGRTQWLRKDDLVATPGRAGLTDVRANIFAGRRLEDASDSVLTDIRSREIGFVFQQFDLDPHVERRRECGDRHGAARAVSR